MVWTDGRPGIGMPTTDVPAKQGPCAFNLRVWSTLHGGATHGDNFATSHSCSADMRVLTGKKRLLNLLQMKPTGGRVATHNRRTGPSLPRAPSFSWNGFGALGSIECNLLACQAVSIWQMLVLEI